MRRDRRRYWETDREQPLAPYPSGGLRRLASLIVLLVLVIVLIQQTSNPRNVERVAHTIGLLTNDPAGESTVSQDSPTERMSPNTASDLEKPTKSPLAVDAIPLDRTSEVQNTNAGPRTERNRETPSGFPTTTVLIGVVVAAWIAWRFYYAMYRQRKRAQAQLRHSLSED